MGLKIEIFFSLVIFSAGASYAVDEEAMAPTAWEKVKEATIDGVDYGKEKLDAAKVAIDTAADLIRTHRTDRNMGLLGHFQFLGTWVPTKFGLSYFYNENASTTYEAEFLTGHYGMGFTGFDIGEISEKRFAVMRRSFGQRSSFNFVMGLYYSDLEARLGNDVISTFTGSHAAEAQVVRAKTAGLSWGLGNRWQTKNGVTGGIDWLNLSLPFFVIEEKNAFSQSTSNQDHKDSVEKALHFFTKIPTFVFLKAQLGISF
jgi:hypothetical protein